MQEREGEKLTITITDVEEQSWGKPESTQVWYTVTAEELKEAVKFVQDDSRETPVPEVGKKYTGKMYGNRFYPFSPKPYTPKGKYDGSGHKHNTALRIAAEYLLGARPATSGEFVSELEEMARAIYDIPVPGTKRSPATQSEPNPSQDEVHDFDTEAPINLDDIPF